MPSASEGSRPWRRRPTRSTPGCSPSSPAGRWFRRSGFRPRRCGPSGSGPGSACTWSAIGRRSKNRISATLMTFGHPCPMADLFGVAGRKLLDSLALPEPWQASLSESLALVDDLTARVDALEVELRDLGADDPSMQLLMTVPGVGWVLAYTIASKDRRHRPLREPQEAGRVYRPVPAGPPVGTEGPARPAREERPQVPALGTRRSRHTRRSRCSLPGAIRAHEAAPRAPARRKGRPGRPRSPAGRGDLARPHEERTLPSGRPRDPFGRLTTPYEIGPPEQPPTRPCPSRRGP